MIDRHQTARHQIGESLPGAARGILAELGVLENVETGPHRPNLGVVSGWGQDDPVIRDAFLDAHGAGWTLDRQAFDATLRQAAIATGAVSMFGKTVATVRRSSSPCGWTIVLRDGTTLKARFIVDATGRSASVARAIGLSEIRSSDKLICRYTKLPAPPVPRRFDGFHLIEATSNGWWYANVLPNGERLVAFHTDSDLDAARLTASVEGFRAELARTRLVASFSAVELWPAMSRILSRSARGQTLEPAAGVNWAAVGDASISFDPLSSQGLMHAVYSGLRLGRAIVDLKLGDSRPLRIYNELIANTAQAYERNRATYYAMERRFVTEPFWARRTGTFR